MLKIQTPAPFPPPPVHAGYSRFFVLVFFSFFLVGDLCVYVHIYISEATELYGDRVPILIELLLPGGTTR